MRYYIACIILFLSTIHCSFGQAYKYIGVTEGLSDSRVLSIQKDRAGFMWFLTYSGIDRYDGKNIKHYRLRTNEGYLSFSSEKNVLKIDSFGNIWVIGSEGQLFKYSQFYDKFVEIQLPEELRDNSLELVEMTDFNEVWYCFPNFCYIYNQDTKVFRQLFLDHRHKHITCIFQYDEETYYIGSDDGVCRTIIRDDKLVSADCIIPTSEFHLPTFIYVHRQSNRMFVGSELSGLMVYDLTVGRIEHVYPYLKDFPISDIVSCTSNQLLISTQGSGVFLYDFRHSTLEQFIYAEYEKPHKMNGNNISALYVDDNKRLWMAVFGRGVTCYDEKLPGYTLYKHHMGNENSLNDDLVNAVLEDSEGDLWFATNNGLSIYNPVQNTWEHLFLRDKNEIGTLKDCIFLSLCEISPGRIVAGGFMTGVYVIEKEAMSVRLLTPYIYDEENNPNFSNKYIRVIYPDKNGVVWTGGSYYLGRTDKVNRTFQDFFIGKEITCIQEKDSVTLLIGTTDGIYSFDKRSYEKKKMRMPFVSQRINTMYMNPNGDLYIGTTNSGLVILYKNGEHEIHRSQTSALLSNTINAIVPKNEEEIVVSTEHNIALFYVKRGVFRNWTTDQGLINANFNPRAGIHTSRGTFVFGSNSGAVEWSDTMRLFRRDMTKVVIDQIIVEDKTSVLTTTKNLNVNALDSIKELVLKHNQNSLALHVVAIDYDDPQHTAFRWKLNGHYDYWTQIQDNSWLQYRDLDKGTYVLHIQNVAREDNRILGEKKLKIVVLPSFWQTSWGILLSLLCTSVVVFLVWRYVRMKITRKRMNWKNSLLVSAVCNIRMPLALIKAAMREVSQQEKLSQKSSDYIKLVTYSTEKLSQMANNLLHVELETNMRELHVGLHDVGKLVQQYVAYFEPLITQEKITVMFDNKDDDWEVWVDLIKFELIFCNLFSNLLRYTPSGGVVHIFMAVENKKWNLVLHNGDSALNMGKQKPVLNEIGMRVDKELLNTELYVIDQLVRAHRGSLDYEVWSSSKYYFKMKFPMKYSDYRKQKVKRDKKKQLKEKSLFGDLLPRLQLQPVNDEPSVEKKGHVLLVEENQEALVFLDRALCDEWDVCRAKSVKVALGMVREYQPDIIVTSLIVSKDTGEDLCSVLKSNMNTSHIPIVLMTSSEDEESVAEGFKVGADYYVTKPFDMFVLRSILTNIQENRRLLQERLAQVDVVHNLKEIKNVNVEQDAKFLTEMKGHIKAHIDSPDFNIDELCAMMGMSRTSLYNKVKTLTNMSPSDIIRDIRMQKACELLLSNECNIMEVSDRLGFSEPKYFREVFKKYYGMSPSEYIKKQTNKENNSTFASK